MLREAYPKVRFIQSDKNLGFAKANNAAFLASKGKVVLFLNPDTELIGPAINILFHHLQELPDSGAIGCRLLNSNGTLQTSCIQSIPTILNQVLDSEASRAKWPRSRLWGTAPLYSASENPQEVEAISGACIMLKRDVFEDVGLFSDDYFMYAEDIDLSYKLRKAGYRNYYLPMAAVTHHGGSSTQQAVSDFAAIMMREAIWRFMRKTRGGLYGLAYRAAMFASASARMMMLFFMSPEEARSHQSHINDGAFRKWWAILRWSLRREKWIKQYYPS
jgi:N-acetylglucosaminyl-diphospho-decaprenol L-rhamnosyltransferase